VLKLVLPEEYRIFTIGPDGHFADVPKIVKFSNDNEAIEKAISMANGVDIEIWNLERRIMRLPGNSPRAQPVKISAARTTDSLDRGIPSPQPRASPSKSLA
jgi:hypothetical protein